MNNSESNKILQLIIVIIISMLITSCASKSGHYVTDSVKANASIEDIVNDNKKIVCKYKLLNLETNTVFMMYGDINYALNDTLSVDMSRLIIEPTNVNAQRAVIVYRFPLSYQRKRN